jgi:hypothetical protein
MHLCPCFLVLPHDGIASFGVPKVWPGAAYGLQLLGSPLLVVRALCLDAPFELVGLAGHDAKHIAPKLFEGRPIVLRWGGLRHKLTGRSHFVYRLHSCKCPVHFNALRHRAHSLGPVAVMHWSPAFTGGVSCKPFLHICTHVALALSDCTGH